MRVALIVPIKSFSEAKGRLDDVLSGAQREQLARWSAGRIVTSLEGTSDHDISVIVVCEGDDVQQWCADHRLKFVQPLEPGLDHAAHAGVAQAAGDGADFVIVAHADLAHPDDLGLVLHDHSQSLITLVPDLDFNGTNVIAMPITAVTEHKFEFMYGSGSFLRHAELAESIAEVSDLSLFVIDDSVLSIDIDTPDDLNIPSVRAVIPFKIEMSDHA